MQQQNNTHNKRSLAFSIKSNRISQCASKVHLITKNNILTEGLNYIVPMFWYEELLALNQNIHNLSQIKVPSLKAYQRVLEIYGLTKFSDQNQRFRLNNQNWAECELPVESALVKQNILSPKNYSKFKTIFAGRLTQDLLSQQEFEWVPISCFLWDKIYNAMQRNKIHEQTKEGEQSQSMDNISEYTVQADCQLEHENANSIVPFCVYFSKQFIVCSENLKANPQQQICHPIKYRNKVYHITKTEIDRQIFKSIRATSQLPVTLAILLKLTNGQNKIVWFHGHLDSRVSIKDYIRSIREKQQKVHQGQNICPKCYFYDVYGEKIDSSAVEMISQAMFKNGRMLISSNIPIEELCESFQKVWNELSNFIQLEFNFPEYDSASSQLIDSKALFEKLQRKIKRAELFSESTDIAFKTTSPSRHQGAINYKANISQRNMSSSQQQETQSVHFTNNSAFKRIEKPNIESSQNQQIIQRQQQQNEEDILRNLGSATTNLDTPQQMFVQGRNIYQGIERRSQYLSEVSSSNDVKSDLSYRSDQMRFRTNKNRERARRLQKNRQKRKIKVNRYLNKKARNFVVCKEGKYTKQKDFEAVKVIKRKLKQPLLSFVKNQKKTDKCSDCQIDSTCESLSKTQIQRISTACFKQANQIIMDLQRLIHLPLGQFKGSYLNNEEQINSQSFIQQMKNCLQEMALEIEEKYEPKADQEIDLSDVGFISDSCFEEKQKNDGNDEQLKTIVDNENLDGYDDEKKYFNIERAVTGSILSSSGSRQLKSEQSPKKGKSSKSSRVLNSKKQIKKSRKIRHSTALSSDGPRQVSTLQDNNAVQQFNSSMAEHYPNHYSEEETS